MREKEERVEEKERRWGGSIREERVGEGEAAKTIFF